VTLRARIFKVFWSTLVYLLVTVVVLAAVALTLARIWLPTAEDYKGEAESWVSDFLGQRVTIDSLNADWRGFEPQLVLEKVQLLSDDGKTIISAFEKVKIGFDLVSSAFRQTVVPGGLVVEGARLVLVRQKDGRFSVSGFATTQTDPADSEATSALLETMLLEQRLLKIENSSLVWRDRVNNDETRLFSDVNITIRNDGSRHQIEGSVFLPQDLGSHMLFFLDLRGNIFSGNDWSGSAQLTAVGIELVNWMTEKRLANLELAKAIVSTSTWARLRSGKLEELRGEVLASDVQLRSQDNPRLNKIDSLSTDFSLELRDNLWQLTLDGLTLIRNGKVWPRMRVDTRYDGTSQSLELEASELEIGNILQLALISDVIEKTAGTYLRDAKPEGRMENITFYSAKDNNGDDVFAFGARFRNVSIGESGSVPGLRGITGEIELSNHDGYVWLDSEDWAIDYSGMFKNTRLFQHLSGSVMWKADQNGQWKIYGNNLRVFDQRAEAKGQFYVRLEPEKAPFLDLAFGLKGNAITRVRKYLPDAMMSEELTKWINNSVLKATIKAGGLVYYGYTDRYPFNERDGHFGLNLLLQETDLRYLEGWPEITSINGQLDMDSHGLVFSSNNAKIYSNQIDSVGLSIKDFYAKDLRLAIAGSVTGSTRDKFKFMYQSPLNEIFAKHLKVFSVSGQSELAIGLDIPLSGEGDLLASGSLLMSDNRLNAAELELDLSNISGSLRFDERGIYGEDISLKFNGIDILADVETVDVGEGREMVFSHTGAVTHKQISQIFKQYVKQPQWSNFIAGDTNADVRFYVPMIDGGPHRNMTLEAFSMMEGVEIKLPTPFGKSADSQRRFSISTELGGEENTLSLALGDTRLALRMLSAAGETSVEKGAVGFGVEPVLPTEHGFHFTGGIPKFFWSEWQPLLMPDAGQPGLLQSEGGGGSVYFDVAVNQTEILSARFADVRVQASNTAQGWTVHASGPEIQGSAYLPSVWNTAPVVLDTKKLHIKIPKTEEESETVDPNDLPQLRFKSEDFSFNDMRFGRTEFSTSAVAGGMRLDEFNSSSEIADFAVKGDWTVDANKHKSNFTIGMKAKNFGQMMDSWGYKDIIDKGDGLLNINANWLGAPTAFSFPTLKGNMEISMNNLRLMDLNVGAAKMLGLLSLEAIPRRLFFDFRDVVQKGVLFDSVQGQFDIQNGDAFSSGMVLTGPSGRMGLAGRIGLAQKEYDLVITFIPKVLDALPVIGGIATGGLSVVAPTVGATVYVMQKLFQSQVDELSAVQYTVTGSWQEPKVVQVKAPSKQKGETEFVDEQ